MKYILAAVIAVLALTCNAEAAERKRPAAIVIVTRPAAVIVNPAPVLLIVR